MREINDLWLDDLLEKAVQEIAKNHRKIIDDWCKAYLAQLYEEGHEIKPGCFTLNQQHDMTLSNGKLGSRYWFEIGVPHYHPKEKNIRIEIYENCKEDAAVTSPRQSIQ